jgi:hypothetical protein
MIASRHVPVLLLLALPIGVAADFVEYSPPGSKISITLEGKTERVNRSLKVKTRVWPEELTFYFDTVKVHKNEAPRDKLVKKVKQLVSDKANPTAEELWAAGKDALMNGAPGALFEVSEALGAKFPEHAPSKSIRSLAAKWEEAIPESDAEEPAIRKLFAGKPDMKIHRTEHFLLLHDVDTKKKKGEKLSRFERRCNLMERVYKAYLAYLFTNGYPVPLPRERLRVVFFNDEADFHAIHQEISKGKEVNKNVAGFYHRLLNASFFYDNASTEEYRELSKLVEDFKKDEAILRKSGGAMDLIQLMKMLNVLKEVEREQHDMEVMSHEIIHHVSAATGLLPRDAPCPKWAAEGLACYFEAPSDCTWSGIGAVNQRRLNGMRAGAEFYRNQFDLEVVAKDMPFSNAGTRGSSEIAYAHGWSFTHFMMNRNFKLLVGYYKELGKLPRFDFEKMDEKKSAEYERLYEAAFRKAIPESEWPSLSAAWKIYHNNLKTDFERASGSAPSGAR